MISIKCTLTEISALPSNVSSSQMGLKVKIIYFWWLIIDNKVQIRRGYAKIECLLEGRFIRANLLCMDPISSVANLHAVMQFVYVHVAVPTMLD